MTFSFHHDELPSLAADLVALLCFEDRLGDGALFQGIDRALDGLVSKVMAEEQFKGKKGQTVTLHTHGRIGCARVMLIGGGPRAELQLPEVRGFAAKAVRAASSLAAKRLALALPYSDGPSQERVSQFLAEGALSGGYRFDKYLTAEKKPKEALAEVVVVTSSDNVEPSRREAVKRGVARGEAVHAAVAIARDLINEPAAVMTPVAMAEAAQRIAKEHRLELKVLGPRECEKLGMGMYLAVSRGSDEEPRFIHLSYQPKGPPGRPRKKVVLIGKGVTFDSGGLSLKGSKDMEDMKIDMSGAAAVLAAIGALAELGSPHEVHAICACTENMLSGKSYKLGDVLRSMSGKTVEVNNTDAEGRLTLGDAISYALKEIAPDELIDFATLTGACMVALGPHIAGVMGNDHSLSERWLQAARQAGEEMWPLPLPERLKEQLKSDVADLKNTGERWGGALTAGLFLKEFVGATPWLHVDIAGPAAAEKEFGHLPKGGTGFAVATIAEYLAPRE